MVHQFLVNNVNLTVPLRSHLNQEIRYCSENMSIFGHMCTCWCHSLCFERLFTDFSNDIEGSCAFGLIFNNVLVNFHPQERNYAR